MKARPPASPSYPLGPALEFLQRLWALDHVLGALSSNMAGRLGVTAQQRLILRCLGTYPGLPAGHLAALLHVDPGTISAALRRLEARGLVERRRDPRDQRRAALGLTAQGRALDRAIPGTVEHAVEGLLAEVDRADLDAAARVLERLTARLSEEIVEAGEAAGEAAGEGPASGEPGASAARVEGPPAEAAPAAGPAAPASAAPAFNGDD